jgi:radical SAM superfamily enzyme YgiQ (UPF0313 family)
MNVLLVYPYCLEKRIHQEDAGVVPLGLYYIGAMLESHGHKATILNATDLKDNLQAYVQILNDLQPQVVGFSIVNANRWGAIDMARMTRQVDSGIKTVFGGVAATFLWRHLLTHFAEVDYVIRGEGEQAFLKLVETLQYGQPVLNEIKGLALRHNGNIDSNGCAEPVADLDRLPDPARYYSFQHVALTRGCPHGCTFCGSPRFWGQKVRLHSPAYFVEQLSRLAAKGIRFFYVSDDTFTLRKSYVIALCRLIIQKQLNISWAAISRVDRIDEEILGWMRKAGCVQISYGVESGSPTIRRRLGKRLATEQIELAFRLTVRYGLLARAYFIYGNPGESDATIDDTIELMHRIKPLSTIFYLLALFPGTSLYEEYLQATGQSDDDIWLQRREDILYCETDPTLSNEQVLAWGRRLRTAFYQGLPQFSAAIELIDDPEFNSLHADFLSRLAMTFDRGDYARQQALEAPERIALQLYQRALTYFPDPRAILGLAVHHQKTGALEEARKLLETGLANFPKDLHLNLCMGITLFQLQDYRRALAYLERLEPTRESLPYIVNTYLALGETAKAQSYREQFGHLLATQ